MPTLTLNTILIVEPKKELTLAYQYLPDEAEQVHFRSTEQASQYLWDHVPDLVVLSASFSPSQVLTILEQVKNSSINQRHLTPIIISVDLNHEMSFVPGTTWANKLEIIHSNSTQQQVELAIKRITQIEKSYGFE